MMERRRNPALFLVHRFAFCGILASVQGVVVEGMARCPALLADHTEAAM
jgi:hypothetical protein